MNILVIQSTLKEMLTKVRCHWSTNNPKEFQKRYQKKVYGRSSGNKTQITIVACASAMGVALLSMVIFQGARLNTILPKMKYPV